MDTCCCEFYRCHVVITDTYMLLAVATKDIVTNVKITSGTLVEPGLYQSYHSQ